jgi:hypothetical protein
MQPEELNHSKHTKILRHKNFSKKHAKYGLSRLLQWWEQDSKCQDQDQDSEAQHQDQDSETQD